MAAGQSKSGGQNTAAREIHCSLPPICSIAHLLILSLATLSPSPFALEITRSTYFFCLLSVIGSEFPANFGFGFPSNLPFRAKFLLICHFEVLVLLRLSNHYACWCWMQLKKAWKSDSGVLGFGVGAHCISSLYMFIIGASILVSNWAEALWYEFNVTSSGWHYTGRSYKLPAPMFSLIP